ncbi:putative aldouronate transport system substrate-binding protein [Pullulanibacillus pueri]|uniref:Lipoprotein LipO n=1 Tax=Pullulanibacillus pueri TaxID=1437324 RepID=A0A8J3A411_9BACL|nr:extracellular solute-binding protein [Pullulanibacillus pueri]MBM7684221.1 putative aldouronate transport system substrate-binding protein [Pullulanibacillus pueri]GGH89005.1 lipoprotein LipO [Pullulanibacillus pueri]
MRKQILVLLLCISILLALAACGPEGKSTTNNDTDKNTASAPGPFGKYDDTISFTIGRQGVAGNTLPKGDTLESNDYLKYVENKLNIKIKYDFSVADADAYKQKVNLAIASGNIPDVMIVNEQQFKQLEKAGMLEDLSSAYSKYASPLIKGYYDSFNGRVLDTVKKTSGGKLDALPDTNIFGQQQLLWLRKDWLDKLNLKVPKTTDELITVLKAFKTQDPDGNNKNDTLGLLGDPHVFQMGGFFTFDPIFNAYHAYPDSWIKDSSGSIVNGSIQPEMKQALAKLQEMYKQGLIDKEFVTKNFDKDAGLVADGQAGAVFAPWSGAWMLSDAVKNNKKAEWIPVLAPLDGQNKYNVMLAAPSGSYLVVKKGYAHPDAVVKALNVEYQGLRLKDPKAADIYKDLGVSWLNWPLNLQLNNENDVPDSAKIYDKAIQTGDTSDLTPSQKQTFQSIKNNIKSPKSSMADYGNWLAYYVGAKKLSSSKLNRIEPAFTGTTKTMDSRGSNLTKLENETFLKIITGQASVDSFDSFVKEWKKIGGDTITKEVNTAVK